jgi:uncharacterized protein YjbI with pentapeptide repeats
MANEEHLKILKQGVEVWSRWREENPEIEPDLREADLSKVDLRKADLREADLSGADLSGADLGEADLRRAWLSDAYLFGTYLSGSNLVGADLSTADVSKANFSEADLSQTYLSGVALLGADLSRAKLIEAHLLEADLSGADLSGADLGKADLSEAYLCEAVLYRAILRGAVLIKANLRGTDLREADLTGAHLRGVNLSEAQMGLTVLGDVDLSTVNGLETVKHHFPSTIGIATVYRSKGRISEAFLRGTGVPDNFITYASSLTGEAIQYYSCFISYSSKDEDFAQRLHNDLQGKEVRCWFAPDNVKGGEKLYDQIDQAIRLHDKLLLVLSENSIYSEWVMTEIRRARKAELRDKRRKLFPIRVVAWEMIRDWECFDADTGKDLAMEVREYFIPDFSHWKDHDSYQGAFDRLLRDLKAEEGKKDRAGDGAQAPYLSVPRQ